MVRNPWGVIGLSIITLGIYFIYWQYVTFRDLKNSSGEGIGGGLGLVFAIFIGIVNAFMIPSEVGHVFQRQGKSPPVTGLTGFWWFLPFVGWFVWVIKVQGRLNEYWESGALGAAGGGPRMPPTASIAGAPPFVPPTGFAPDPSVAPVAQTLQPPSSPAQAYPPSPGPGYWLASDGNWYPPEQRPSRPPPATG
jgi:hypothetical protein